MVMTNIPSGVPQPKNMYGLGGGDINSFRGIKVLLVYGEEGGDGTTLHCYELYIPSNAPW